MLGVSLSTQAISAEKPVREDKFFRSVEVAGNSGFVKSQRIEIPPGFAAPSHVHPVPTFGVVNQGTIAYQEEGGEETLLNEGDTFFEPQDVNILKFNNTGSDTAVFTVFYIVDKQESPTLHINR